jgi:HD-GYP domain-containing protein (c-di-GMP phosphodiesterase class II)
LKKSLAKKNNKMFSILDILRKHREEKKRLIASGEAQGPGMSDGAGTGQTQVPSEAEGWLKDSNFSFSSAVNKGIEEERLRQLRVLYEEALELARKIYKPDLQENSDLKSQLNGLMEKLVSQLSSGNKESLRLCLSDYSKAEDYLYCHAVNVCFMSIEIAMGLGYESQKLIELAAAAFLHDIGMVGYLDLINKPEKFNEADLNQIKEHPKAGLLILNKISKEFPSAVFEVVSQEHERVDGAGYPKGSKNGEISEFSQIVGLVDVYEAMIHRRPYRSKFTLSQAISKIIENKSAFGYKIIKILIERIGIFPVGSYVRLNTKEIALVLRDNPKSPLRPVINITMDPLGKELKQPRQIDLSGNPVIYIEECIDCLNKNI